MWSMAAVSALPHRGCNGTQGQRAARTRALRCAASGAAGQPSSTPRGDPQPACLTKTAIRKLPKVRWRGNLHAGVLRLASLTHAF